MVSFSRALEHIKNHVHGAIRRSDWPVTTFVQAQIPDEHSKMTIPYLFMTSGDDRFPWTPDAKSLFHEEWEMLI